MLNETLPKLPGSSSAVAYDYVPIKERGFVGNSRLLQSSPHFHHHLIMRTPVQKVGAKNMSFPSLYSIHASHIAQLCKTSFLS
jgi:hypothetical protein